MSNFWARKTVARVGSLMMAAASLSCVMGAKLREDAKLIEKKIANAREAGSYRCAPQELAKAEAHFEFLRYELEMGDFRRAQRHRRAALENINRAIDITDPNECADKRVLIVAPADRDGDGILDDADQCPDEPEDIDTFEDKDGCPDPDNDADTVLDVEDSCPLEPGDPALAGCPLRDRDGDGVADDTDQCPDVPEDLDGYKDEDGCPETEDSDRDGDGILDSADSCPDDPEDVDGYQDEDGCPDPDDRDGDGVNDDVDQCPDVPGKPPTGCPRRVLVVKTDDKIEIKKQIRFETNKAKIRGRISFEILDQVASVMKSNPGITVVIEGHTDSVGPADYNLRLSDSRANSVRGALVERGVESGRMEAIGYGESKPIASNRSRRGRAANRRVEFNIVQKEPAAAPDATP
jgi:outer membrane protein OmpA-like peptidoglycan-associated protein